MKKASASVIGGFVVGAIALGVTGLVILGSGRLFAHTQTFVAYFSGSVQGLEVGAPVKFKGVDVGSVEEVRINISRGPTDDKEMRIPVLVSLDDRKIAEGGARLDLEDPATLERLVARGLRAQLGTASLITGLRYVALDIFSGSPVERVADPTVAYPEIPTLPGELEGAQRELLEILGRLSKLDLDRLMGTLTGTLESIGHAAGSADRLLASLDGLARMPELPQAVRNVRDAAARLRTSIDGGSQSLGALATTAQRALDRAATMVGPDSRVLGRFEQALVDVSGAARSLRRLADELDRDPAALLRGRSP